MRAFALAPAVALAACAHASPTPAPRPVDATGFVRSLAVESAAGHGTVVDGSIDRSFGAEVPSNVPLESVFATPPECTPVYSEGPGWTRVVVPEPSFGSDATEVPRFMAIVDELRTSTEVTAACARVDGEMGPALYVVVVRRGDDGSFHVLAWRDLRGEASSE